jgi:hypothetical protein
MIMREISTEGFTSQKDCLDFIVREANNAVKAGRQVCYDVNEHHNPQLAPPNPDELFHTVEMFLCHSVRFCMQFLKARQLTIHFRCHAIRSLEIHATFESGQKVADGAAFIRRFLEDVLDLDRVGQIQLFRQGPVTKLNPELALEIAAGAGRFLFFSMDSQSAPAPTPRSVNYTIMSSTTAGAKRIETMPYTATTTAQELIAHASRMGTDTPSSLELWAVSADKFTLEPIKRTDYVSVIAHRTLHVMKQAPSAVIVAIVSSAKPPVQPTGEIHRIPMRSKTTFALMKKAVGDYLVRTVTDFGARRKDGTIDWRGAPADTVSYVAVLRR